MTQSLAPSVTLDAVDALKAFSKPVLLAWGDRDKLFPLAHARRLEADFPNARHEVIEGSSTYVMLDRPADLAGAIERFSALATHVCRSRGPRCRPSGASSPTSAGPRGS